MREQTVKMSPFCFILFEFFHQTKHRLRAFIFHYISFTTRITSWRAWQWNSLDALLYKDLLYVMCTCNDIIICFAVKIKLESVGPRGQIILKSYDGSFCICVDYHGTVIARVSNNSCHFSPFINLWAACEFSRLYQAIRRPKKLQSRLYSQATNTVKFSNLECCKAR